MCFGRQLHQDYLARNLFEYNPRLQHVLLQITNFLEMHVGPGQATRQAYARIYRIVRQQAAVLAYIDIFWMLGVLSLLAIGLLFVAKKANRGQAPMGH